MSSSLFRLEQVCEKKRLICMCDIGYGCTAEEVVLGTTSIYAFPHEL
jgi:hypothetical protein